jgi:hypothetical protein
MPEPKDAIIGILGASVALAGLLLIFSGLLFTQAAAFPRDTTDDATIERFKRAGRLACWPFLLSLAISGLSLAWLLRPVDVEFAITCVAFFVLLGVTVVYGFWSAWKLL